VSVASSLNRAPKTSLPIHVKPHTGEHVDLYIRRLAVANHMPPSVLIEILHGRIGRSAAVLRLDILAVVSGRPETALRYALQGLPANRKQPLEPRGTPQPPIRRRIRGALQETLFLAIRQDAAAQDNAITVEELCRRHGVRPVTVRRALDPDADPSPKRIRGTRTRVSKSHAAQLELLAPTIDSILGQRPYTPARQIWEILVDDHEANLPYRVVREFASARRNTPGTAVRRAGPRRPRGQSTAEFPSPPEDS